MMSDEMTCVPERSMLGIAWEHADIHKSGYLDFRGYHGSDYKPCPRRALQK